MINNQGYTPVDGDSLWVGMKVRCRLNNITGEMKFIPGERVINNQGASGFLKMKMTMHTLISAPTEGGMGWIRVDLEKLEAHGSQSGGDLKK